MEETLQNGPLQALRKFFLQQATLSPIFETFKVKLMAFSFVKELTCGGSQYIPTGRGLAIDCVEPHELFKGYAVPAIRDGAILMMLLLLSHAARSPALSGRQWPVALILHLTAFSFMLAPYIFNPSAFVLQQVPGMYRRWIQWLLAPPDHTKV